MTTLKINESYTVQFPMVKHAHEVGWTVMPPEDAEAKRLGRSNMLFRAALEAKLQEFNAWLSEEQTRAVVDTIEALPANIEGNREVLSWIRGERQWYDEVEKRHRPVQVVDFANPVANDFIVTWEWKIEPPARKGNRADVIFVVNGLPVAIVEHKNPKDGGALDRAVKQLRRYEKETPELLAAPQLFNVTHLLDYWYGVTWNANRRFISRWKQTPDEEYRFAVQAFFEPTDFLRTLQHWILFYVEDGETRKSVLREHQRRAIDKIVARCADPDKTRGLIWHTQGSGKTFTLLTAARLILENKARFNNGTVILVADRIELEGQLREWVDRLLGEMQANDIAVMRANTKAELQALLDADFRGLIISMIYKFEEIKKDSSPRNNIYVFIDEAHRSVAKDLGTYLMAALPNATIIGFTGTPVGSSQSGSGSFQIFGLQDESGYLDKYSIKESIDDGTTLPIRYMMAPSNMTIPNEQLDEEFFDLAESEDATDVEELNRVLDRAVGIRAFLSADDRVEQVAEFVANHFRENVDPLHYKAFLVAVDRETCAKYKLALDRHLPAEWSEVVYSSNAADVVDRPKVAELQLSEPREQEVRKSFKKPDEQPKILIVTDKLLTGYDAPVLYAMYLDKPMRDHVLLQAIARVNRPYVDAEGVSKRVGLVVDFVGVLRELQKALRFDSADINGAIEDLETMMTDLHQRIGQATTNYLQADSKDSPDQQLEKIVYGRFIDPDARKTFFEDYKDIEALWEILSPSAELRDHIVTYKRLSQLYAAVRNAYSETGSFLGDLEYKTRRLIQGSAEQEGLGRIAKVVTFDVATLELLKSEDGPDEGKIYNLLRGLRKEIDDDPAKAVVLRALKERADQVIKNLEERKVTGMAAMDDIAALVIEKDEAQKAAEKSGLSDVAFAVHWQLSRETTLSAAGLDSLAVAREVEAVIAKFPNWVENPDEQRRLRLNLYKPVIKLPDELRKAVVEQIMQVLDQAKGI
ncbi:HsdR family type I site-specific deoxyribonuclease [Mycobacteroides abscessus]|uniref:type I restriction endonuclease subunit R n=1 Tax=Mycobacteroides abscessus TaxID=36809 RepID=UPI0005E3C4C2|nr:HsdR family type I site-specific deoxyribonuclease [Mycobacteroides abscessus]CPR38285.1 HsdR family type I site-specific deoxyribonuclease [Mycobacteroides abscessus]CPR74958.1 HsdR family type I site-specific deoxyribonuclease [Mycobacteroides abscessus]CPS03116.1 HsdR family type I site-specific deoxyribonuclease [Mycobacteroides abscessus]CPS08806.1 HsdR family type I site-specific deoxyribonuclease [Mycobacteroides abscessus]CPS53698.1 HsdR family type I site-specific deoxyribonuclease